MNPSLICPSDWLIAAVLVLTWRDFGCFQSTGNKWCRSFGTTLKLEKILNKLPNFSTDNIAGFCSGREIISVWSEIFSVCYLRNLSKLCSICSQTPSTSGGAWWKILSSSYPDNSSWQPADTTPSTSPRSYGIQNFFPDWSWKWNYLAASFLSQGYTFTWG